MIQHKNNHNPLQKKPSPHHRISLPKSSESISPNSFEAYAQLLNGASDPIFILSLNLQIEFANVAADKFFNFLSGHAQGRYFKDCVTAESLHKVNAAIKQVRLKNSQFRFEVEAIGGHRERVITEVTIFPIHESRNISGYHLTIRDVSQDRQIEGLIRESQKMEAIQYFVSGTTKELQHPLMAILKRIENIENKYRGRSFEYVSFREFTGIMDFFAIMHKQVKYCYDTTAKLANLNKKHLKFESNYCQANNVIREVARLKEQVLKNSNIKVKLRLFANLSLTALGEIEFNQIISHLIDNAMHAMPAGGQLLISTSNLPDARVIRVEISDSGVGISPEDLPHIFEPFFTTKQRGVDKSAGLGLSIVYSLVKAGHGQIHVKSSLRKGTTVELILPIAHHGKDLPHSRK